MPNPSLPNRRAELSRIKRQDIEHLERIEQNVMVTLAAGQIHNVLAEGTHGVSICQCADQSGCEDRGMRFVQISRDVRGDMDWCIGFADQQVTGLPAMVHNQGRMAVRMTCQAAEPDNLLAAFSPASNPLPLDVLAPTVTNVRSGAQA